MITSKNILPVTTVKKNLLKLLRRVQEENEPLVITKDGKAAGVLLSPEEYEGLLETLEILGDKKLLKQLHQSEISFQEGQYFSHEQVFKE